MLRATCGNTAKGEWPVQSRRTAAKMFGAVDLEAQTQMNIEMKGTVTITHVTSVQPKNPPKISLWVQLC